MPCLFRPAMVTLTHTLQEGRETSIINYDHERHYLAAIGCLRDMYARQLITVYSCGIRGIRAASGLDWHKEKQIHYF